MLLVVLYGLGVLVLGMAYVAQAGVIGRIVLVMVGLAALFYAEKSRRTGISEIILTDAGLLTAQGDLIAPTEQFRSVERGAFALKPSNGFTLHLKDKQPRAWVPGLWWRLGRRVGVGGIVNAGAAKFMAEQIALRLAARG